MKYIGDLYSKVNGKYIRLEMTSSDVDKVQEENNRLKKSAVVWNRIECKGDEVFGNPAEDGKEYLLRLKNGYDVDELDSGDGGFFFPAHDWCEIKAWAEIPEATE